MLDIPAILTLHAKWLRGEPGGKRANLYGANLRSADLSSANLYGASLRSADLYGADLYGANLRSADLSNANLRSADLSSADLRSADLSSADLRSANLSSADLRSANLSSAKMEPADAAALSILPDEGDVIGWKKCRYNVIVKLLILNATPRSNATGRKCRAREVRVLEVFGAEFGLSARDSNTKYIKDRVVKCDTWCEDRWQECAGGIHFFITRAEAEAYSV